MCQNVSKIDYSKGLIYKLCCKDPQIEDIYIGSTTNFIQRKKNHKSDCNNKNRKHFLNNKYKFIRETGGFENWDIILIEYYPCNSKKELECRERYYIEKLKATLNHQLPGRSDKEYYQDNKDKINQQSKEWRKDNIDKSTQYEKEYRKNNKHKIREYVEKNKEKIKEYKKEYRKNNECKLRELNRIKIECKFCKSIIQKYKLNRHQQTLKCKKFQLQDYSD